MKLEVVTDLEKYFLEEINKQEDRLPHDWLINPYIAKLLTKYAYADNYWIKEENKLQKPWLFKLLIEASEAVSKNAQKDKYQNIGDISLYSLIWCHKEIQQSIVSPSYYLQVGQEAYNQVNNLSSDPVLLFISLSQNFSKIVSRTQKIFY